MCRYRGCAEQGPCRDNRHDLVIRVNELRDNLVRFFVPSGIGAVGIDEDVGVYGDHYFKRYARSRIADQSPSARGGWSPFPLNARLVNRNAGADCDASCLRNASSMISRRVRFSRCACRFAFSSRSSAISMVVFIWVTISTSITSRQAEESAYFPGVRIYALKAPEKSSHCEFGVPDRFKHGSGPSGQFHFGPLHAWFSKLNQDPGDW